MEKGAIFIDKDGTLVENDPYNVDPARIRLVRGAHQALLLLKAAGYRFVVITNQSGVARGIFKEEALLGVEERLQQLLSEIGVTLSGFYYCPHHPQGALPEYAIECDCRKPKPGLILQAAQELNIDLESSWFIGDILDDVEAGTLAGCCTVLVDRGSETQWIMRPERQPDFIVNSLEEAAIAILGKKSVRSKRRPVVPYAASGK